MTAPMQAGPPMPPPGGRGPGPGPSPEAAGDPMQRIMALMGELMPLMQQAGLSPGDLFGAGGVPPEAMQGGPQVDSEGLPLRGPGELMQPTPEGRDPLKDSILRGVLKDMDMSEHYSAMVGDAPPGSGVRGIDEPRPTDSGEPEYDMAADDGRSPNSLRSSGGYI